MKLYHHKTDGGAEYLTDNFVICPNGEKEGVFKGSKFVVRIDGDITKDAELNFNLDDKTFLTNADPEEISSVIESFLNRAKERNIFKISEEDEEIGEILFLDKWKTEIIKEMIKDFKSYKN